MAVREIVKDTEVLSRVSKEINFNNDADLNQTIVDMIDTAESFRDKGCVGISAIQIGVEKRIIAVMGVDRKFHVYINPTVVKLSGAPELKQEGCLSIDGVRTIMRYPSITILYAENNKKHKYVRKTFRGFEAEVVQHEIDHLNGVMI